MEKKYLIELIYEKDGKIENRTVNYIKTDNIEATMDVLAQCYSGSGAKLTAREVVEGQYDILIKDVISSRCTKTGKK